uniref:Uncharacterized protein n=1 Tax=Glossina palpalis gambiensis TaxID=67801 RepID=A0A1B0AYQ7_9MUSC
ATLSDSSISERLHFIEAGDASVIGELQRLTPREKLKDWFGEPIAAPPEIGVKFKRDSSPHKNLLKVTTDLIDFDLGMRSSLTNLSFMLLLFANGLRSGIGGAQEPLCGSSAVIALTLFDILYFGV